MDQKIPSSPDRFKANLLTLAEIINEMFEESVEAGIIKDQFGLFFIVKTVISRSSGENMIKNFIKRTNEHWDKIREEDEEYFKSIGLNLFSMVEEKGLDKIKQEDEELKAGGTLVEKFSSSHIKNFKTILESSYNDGGEEVEVFDKIRRKNVWKIMQSFVKISLVFIHENRKPDEEGRYTVEFFPDIPVKETAKSWGVKSIK